MAAMNIWNFDFFLLLLAWLPKQRTLKRADFFGGHEAHFSCCFRL